MGRRPYITFAYDYRCGLHLSFANTTREARQGVTGHNVRYVLGFSVAALIIVFGIIWLIYFA